MCLIIWLYFWKYIVYICTHVCTSNDETGENDEKVGISDQIKLTFDFHHATGQKFVISTVYLKLGDSTVLRGYVQGMDEDTLLFIGNKYIKN